MWILCKYNPKLCIYVSCIFLFYSWVHLQCCGLCTCSWSQFSHMVWLMAGWSVCLFTHTNRVGKTTENSWIQFSLWQTRVFVSARVELFYQQRKKTPQLNLEDDLIRIRTLGEFLWFSPPGQIRYWENTLTLEGVLCPLQIRFFFNFSKNISVLN